MRSDAPWSLPVRLNELGAGKRITLAADEAERRRIAEALDLVAVEALDADLELRPWLDGVDIGGRWRAEVVQTCGVTLDEFASSLAGEFRVRALPPDSAAAPPASPDVSLDPEAEDPPDVAEGGVVDVAAYVVEHLALELDPFPRKPGVEFEALPAESPPSPFAVLAALKPGSRS